MNRCLISIIAAFCISVPYLSKAQTKLTLSDAIERSKSANKEIEIYRQNLRAASHRQSMSTSRFLPEVNAEFSLGTARDLDPSLDNLFPTSPREYNKYNAGIVMRQSLFRGFTDYFAYQSARLDFDLNDLTLLEKYQEIRAQVIEAYFGIQLDLAKLAAELEVEAARQEQMRIANSRFKAGAVTEVDVLRSRYELQSQKPVIASLRTEIEKKRLHFAQLIGLPLDEPFELSADLRDAHGVWINTSLPSVAEAFAQALESNVEIRRLRTEQKKNQSTAAERRGQHAPHIDFTLRAETRANRRQDIGIYESQRYLGLLEMNVQLFTGLNSFYERSEAAAVQASIEAEFENSKQQILRQIDATLRDIQLSKLRSEAGKVNVELSQRTVEQSLSQYRVGSVTINIVLESFAQLLQAKKEYAQAQFDGIKAGTQLQNIIGSRIEARDKGKS